MENTRGRDARPNNDFNRERRNEQQNRRDVNLNGFDGMNYEQQRESYKADKRFNRPDNSPDRRNLRRDSNP